MITTLLFGGLSRERLVSTATAQSIASAIEDIEIWHWAEDNHVYMTSLNALMAHERPFEFAFRADGVDLGPLEIVLAHNKDRLLVLGLHGGSAENGELQGLCEANGIAFTGSGSKASQQAFNKNTAKRLVAAAGVPVPARVEAHELRSALSYYKKLIAKPVADGSSFGLHFIATDDELTDFMDFSSIDEFLVEPCIPGAEATCGVLHHEGRVIALPPVEIVPAEGAFDYNSKYLNSQTQEICPARFDAKTINQIKDLAIKAHTALGCEGYSRTDFIISQDGPIFLETNTLPGLTKASLFPKSLKVQGIAFSDFLKGQIMLAKQRSGQ